jgi:hypothetical protein
LLQTWSDYGGAQRPPTTSPLYNLTSCAVSVYLLFCYQYDRTIWIGRPSFRYPGGKHRVCTRHQCSPRALTNESSIVFIHGLGGDRVKTWTWEGHDRVLFWPKDLLPQACPTARILSFGYNADFAHFYPFYGPKFISGQLTIDDHSTALSQSLIGLRETTNTVGNRRPYLRAQEAI